MRGFISLLGLVLIAGSAHADSVVSCHDGDTCRVKKDSGQVVSVRFKGIDAPEIKQPFGIQARDYMRRLAVGKSVRLACKGKAQTREACWVFLNGQDLGRSIVQAGLAWDYPKYSAGYYRHDQADAKAKGIGLWSGKPIPPWEWRKR